MRSADDPHRGGLRRPDVRPLSEQRAARRLRGRRLGLAYVLGLAEQSLDGLVEERLAGGLVRELSRPFQQVAIRPQPREAQIGEPRLARADELPLPADLGESRSASSKPSVVATIASRRSIAASESSSR